MARRAPRIAFYGGMANNCYLVASQMHALGMDVVHILDHLDRYAISQPIWEDFPLTLAHEQLNATPHWGRVQWDDIARENGWCAPRWVVDPVGYAEECEPDRNLIDSDPDLNAYGPAPADHHKKIIAIMRSCDIVFVSNVHAIILAMMSERPYIICPAGGELMVASGLIRGDGSVGATLELQRRLMIRGFKEAQAVFTNTPFSQHRSLTDGWWNLIRIFGKCRFRRVSLPFATTPPLPKSEKRKLLRNMTDKLGLAPVDTELFVFVPSRIDYRWKGHDRIAEALVGHPDRYKFTLLVAGWGADYTQFREALEPVANIRVMNCALSKPMLRDMYQASDLVIDQLTLGHIGSVAREAAAMGTPVMAWIDEFKWLPRLRPNLPVLNAKTAQDVAGWFACIAAGTVDLVREGEAGRSWIKRYSSPKLMRDALVEEFERAKSANS